MTAINMMTAGKVRAILRKAGFKSSIKYTTSVPGYYDYTEGYEVQAIRTHDSRMIFRIRHRRGDGGFGRTGDAGSALVQYGKALDAAGLMIDRTEEYEVVVR